MSAYTRNKERAKFRPTKPTLTDQSAALTTDRHVIVHQFLTTGQNSRAATGVSFDLTHYPDNLRDMIKLARQAERLRRQLPPQLRDLTDEQLHNLKKSDLTAILKPPAPQPDANKENDK